MRRLFVPLSALLAVTSFLLGMVASSGRGGRAAVFPQPAASAAPVVIQTAANPAPVPVAGPVDFSVVAERLNAAIVNVDTAVRPIEREPPRRWQQNDDRGPREGSGSGFVIDATGYILTNHHVIDGADRVTVTLSDGRSFRAVVIGADPAIDAALIKIEGAGPLPVAPIGHSASLRAGEWVCAIGNPLGYVHSVTVGVVSFLGRKLFDQSLDEFIQTDAAISFGNSGGPLINARGEVVGITTAISTQASNIGFAVPIDQVMAVLAQMRETGRVSRGYIGVSLGNVTPALADALRLGRSRGALVQDVTDGTPAARAGLRSYDVIAAVDGQAVTSDDALIRIVAARLPGSVARLEIWRDGAPRDVMVKLTERPLAEPTRASRVRADLEPAEAPRGGPLGVITGPLTAAAAQRLGVPAGVTGVMITDLDATGAGREAKLRRGQIVMEINRRPVTTPEAFAQATSRFRAGDAVALLVYDPLSDQRLIVLLVLPGDARP